MEYDDWVQNSISAPASDERGVWSHGLAKAVDARNMAADSTSRSILLDIRWLCWKILEGLEHGDKNQGPNSGSVDLLGSAHFHGFLLKQHAWLYLYRFSLMHK